MDGRIWCPVAAHPLATRDRHLVDDIRALATDRSDATFGVVEILAKSHALSAFASPEGLPPSAARNTGKTFPRSRMSSN